MAIPKGTAPRFSDAYLQGVELFNAGRYYEAHEALEEIWRTCPRDSQERLFYQALIQIAAACLHRARGRWRPALRQYARATDKLARITARHFLGMNVAELRNDLDTTFADLTAASVTPLCPPPPWQVRDPAPEPRQ
jgi:predicted metal-dependent hydrolase